MLIVIPVQRVSWRREDARDESQLRNSEAPPDMNWPATSKWRRGSGVITGSSPNITGCSVFCAKRENRARHDELECARQTGQKGQWSVINKWLSLLLNRHSPRFIYITFVMKTWRRSSMKIIEVWMNFSSLTQSREAVELIELHSNRHKFYLWLTWSQMHWEFRWGKILLLNIVPISIEEMWILRARACKSKKFTSYSLKCILFTFDQLVRKNFIASGSFFRRRLQGTKSSKKEVSPNLREYHTFNVFSWRMWKKS